MPQQLPPDSDLEVVVVPRTHDLGDNFEVRRPCHRRSGAWSGRSCSSTRWARRVFAPGAGWTCGRIRTSAWPPSPICSTAKSCTATAWAACSAIRPGDVNWMTAGRGIVHSERTRRRRSRRQASSLSGLQPGSRCRGRKRRSEPSFLHTGMAELPVEEGDDVSMRLIAGELPRARRSPVPTCPPLFYADVHCSRVRGRRFLPNTPEQAIYVRRASSTWGTTAASELANCWSSSPGNLTLAALARARPD